MDRKKCPRCQKFYESPCQCNCFIHYELHTEYEHEEINKIKRSLEKPSEHSNEYLQSLIQNKKEENFIFKQNTSKDLQTKKGPAACLTEDPPSDVIDFILEKEQNLVGMPTISITHSQMQKLYYPDTFQEDNEGIIQRTFEDGPNAVISNGMQKFCDPDAFREDNEGNIQRTFEDVPNPVISSSMQKFCDPAACLTEDPPSDVIDFILEKEKNLVGMPTISITHSQMQKLYYPDTFREDNEGIIQRTFEDVPNAVISSSMQKFCDPDTFQEDNERIIQITFKDMSNAIISSAFQKSNDPDTCQEDDERGFQKTFEDVPNAVTSSGLEVAGDAQPLSSNSTLDYPILLNLLRKKKT